MLGNDCVELFYDLSVSWQFNKNSAMPRPWRNDVKWFMKGELVENVTGLVVTLWRFWRGELGWTLPPCLKDFLCARRSRKCWLTGVSCLSNSCWDYVGHLPWNKWLFSLPRHFSSGSAPSCTELRTGQSNMISGQCICVDLGVYVLRASKINKAANLMFPWIN